MDFLLEEELCEPDRLDKRSTGQLYYPRARIDKKMPTQGEYLLGSPHGAVIHYTASGASIYDIDHGIENHLCYWLIAQDGTVFQTAPLNRWGWHAGVSSHPILGEKLSSKLIGIEVDCPGKLDRTPHGWKTWYGESVPNEMVNIVDTSGVEEGFYAFTMPQHYALEQLLIWLKINNPSIFKFDYVLGHDEISPRKSDPGGSLRMNMPKFRGMIDRLYKNKLYELGVLDVS